MKFTLTIENPSPTDKGMYVLGTWAAGGTTGATGKFQLKDMSNSSDWQPPQPVVNPLRPHIRTLDDRVAMANPTFEDTMAAEPGFSDTNLWLEWMKYSTDKHKKTNCYVCGSARPHLGTVPLLIPEESEKCFLSLFTNTTTNHSSCEKWKKDYPIVTKTPRPSESITICPGNYTCHSNYQGKGRFLGNFTEGYCST